MNDHAFTNNLINDSHLKIEKENDSKYINNDSKYLKKKYNKLENKFNELNEENKKFKFIFDECIQTIYDAIKNYSPNLLEENDLIFASQENQTNILEVNRKDNNLLTINNIPDSRDSKNSISSLNNSNNSFSTDKDMISKAVELFKKYNKEINEKNIKLEKQVNEMEMNNRTYKIMADEYKNAWELALKKNEKLQFDPFNFTSKNDNYNENVELNEGVKSDLANFTVEDLIEAGHINLDELNKNSARYSENFKKKFSSKNLILDNLINNNIFLKGNICAKNNDILNFDNNIYYKNDDIKEENYLKPNFEKDKKESNKFSFSNYLEKFNDPNEYKILTYKKLNNDLIWYLLINKNIPNNNTTNKIDIENRGESNFARNTSNINDLDLNMIKRIVKKKSSNNIIGFSSLDDKEGKRNANNSNNNLIKNYDYYMWIPGKMIANNLSNFEFEKNSSESNTIETGILNNKDKNMTQSYVCEKCEKSKKDMNNLLQHQNELEKKYSAMLDEKDLEIKDLLNLQEDLMKKLSDKGQEIENYKETCDKLLKASREENINNSSNVKIINENIKTVSLEKYDILLNEFRDEQDKGYELMKVYEQLKSDYDKIVKKLFDLSSHDKNLTNKETKNNDNILQNSILDTDNLETKAINKSFINKTCIDINNKEINEYEVSELLEMHNRNSLGGIGDLKDLAKKINNNFNTVPTGSYNKSQFNDSNNNNNSILKGDNYNGHDFTLNKTDGYYTVKIITLF